MKVTNENLDKLQAFFEERYNWVKAGNIPTCVDQEVDIRRGSEWIWTIFMNHFDCLIVNREDLVESFADMVNFGDAVKRCVCLNSPDGDGFILVPPELAERVLVMGGLA